MSRLAPKVEAMLNDPMAYVLRRLRMEVKNLDEEQLQKLEQLASQYLDIYSQLSVILQQLDSDISDKALREELGL